LIFRKNKAIGEKTSEKEMSFLDHLEELRWHLIRSLISICVFAIAAFILKDFMFGQLILGPSKADFFTYRMFCKLGELTNSSAFCVDELPFIIQNRNITAQFTIHITYSLVAGLILAFPYVFWEMWRFISPGLYDKERSVSRGAVFSVSMLFAMGVLFGYYVVTPISINFLTNYQLDPSIQNEIDLTSYVSTVIMMVMACAIMFQLPVVIFFLTSAGIVTPDMLKAYRKHSIIVILIISAVITPPDVISQVLVAIPIMILYDIGLSISKVIYRRKREELEAELNS
jgi:sec-independent protein translocase protein TatC